MRNRTGNGYSGFLTVLGLLILITGAVITVQLPAMRTAAWGILAIGAALIFVAFLLSLRRVGRALVSRQGKIGAGSMVMASTLIGIVVILNAISFQGFHRFDVTGAAQFTLTSQTKDILKGLTAPVKAITFLTPTDTTGIGTYIISLMTEYQNYTDKFTFQVIDPDEHPDQARQYGITQYETVAFESGSHRQLVPPQDIATEAEHAFTSAILQVTGTIQKKIYFLTGHSEANISSTNSDGYSKVRNGLRDNLYQVDTLDLLFTPAIPKDCAVLVVAGPREQLSDNETAIIQSYLATGGAAMFLLNPGGVPAGTGSLLSKWGVDIADGTVIDPTSYAAPSMDSPSVPRIRDFFGLTVAYFPGSLALVPQEKPQGVFDVTALLWTSKDAWLEKDFTPGKAPVFDDGKDLKGPLALGVLITPTPPPTPTSATAPMPPTPPDTRIIIMGDSDFASDQHFYNGNNGQLFVQAVNVLAEGKEVISIDRKVMPFRRLVTGPETTSFIQYSSVGLVPMLVLLAGGIVWWRRK